MATYNLRRFAHPDGLKAIAPKHLLAFLEPHRAYFASRGLRLPPPSAANGPDYERLVSVLMDPVLDTPKELLDALFFVHEMSTDECMDVLLEEAESHGLSLNGQTDPDRCGRRRPSLSPGPRAAGAQARRALSHAAAAVGHDATLAVLELRTSERGQLDVWMVVLFPIIVGLTVLAGYCSLGVWRRYLPSHRGPRLTERRGGITIENCRAVARAADTGPTRVRGRWRAAEHGGLSHLSNPTRPRSPRYGDLDPGAAKGSQTQRHRDGEPGSRQESARHDRSRRRIRCP